MRVSRTIVYGLIAVLIAGALGSGLANGAAKKKVKTKVSIKFQGSDYGDSFSGKVKAKPKKVRGKTKRKLRRKCAKRRKVIVYRRQGTGKVAIGRTKTNKRGRWVRSVNGLADPGRYFAQAKKKKVKVKGTKYVCKKGKSKRITVS